MDIFSFTVLIGLLPR